MRYTDRTQFTYDPALNTIADTAIALRLHDEYIRKYSPAPNPPKFFEVDRGDGAVDPMWQMPVGANVNFTRELELPAINIFKTQTFKPKVKFDSFPTDRVTTRRDQFWLSNLSLQAADYMPMRGDQVYWNGYRHGITLVIVPPESYWGQTGVWLGLVVECEILGAKVDTPVAQLATPVPAETAPAAPPVAPMPNPWFPFDGSRR
jgi:hypothetical protein